MSAEFHKPTKFPGDRFEAIIGGEDPAQILRAAHETAQALVGHGRTTEDPEVVDRLVAYTDVHGIEALAELWSRSSAGTLPGALWRIYLLRLMIREDPEGTSVLFQRGSEVLRTIDTAVAGAVDPTGPAEITALADDILRGLFTGDFAVALDRASAFSRIIASGALSVADDAEGTEPKRASTLTTRASRLTQMAGEFAHCARLHRGERLE